MPDMLDIERESGMKGLQNALVTDLDSALHQRLPESLSCSSAKSYASVPAEISE